MTRSLMIAAAAALGFGLVAPAAQAAGCPSWVCGDNGTRLNGVVLNSDHEAFIRGEPSFDRRPPEEDLQGPLYNGITPQESTVAEQPAVTTVILPSGETVDLR